ncbi:ATP-binding cassette protein subfamily C member 1 [Lotmaria passim]
MNSHTTNSTSTPHELPAEQPARVDFPETSAEAALDDLKERDREQQVARSAWAEHVRQLWGPEPPYEQQPEDRSGAVLGSLFYSWMGRYIFQAAREVGVVGHYLKCLVRRKSTFSEQQQRMPEHGPGAFHRGVVDEEHLFDLLLDNTKATCERVEDIIFETTVPSAVQAAESVSRLRASSPMYGSVFSSTASLPPARSPRVTPRLASAATALLHTFQLPLLLLGPLRFLVEGSAVLTPMALSWYVAFLESRVPSAAGAANAMTVSTEVTLTLTSRLSLAAKGMWCVLLLFFLSLVRSVAAQKYTQLSSRYAYAARSALSACVAAKCMVVAPKSLCRPELNVGRIVNFLATDIACIESTFLSLWMTVTVPIQMLVALVLLYRSMGWAAGISLLMLLLSLPLQICITRLLIRYTGDMTQKTDARLRCVNEFLAGIRPVKLMGLERTFEREINRRRVAEILAIRRYQLTTIANTLLSKCIPSCTTAAVMIAYYHSGNAMSPSVIYPALSLLALMETPFQLTTYLIGVYSQFFVSMRRLTSFLAADDAAARDVLEEVEAAREADSAAAVFAHATISSYKPVPLPTPSWRRDDGEPHFELRVQALLTDVDLRIPRGRLTVVLGPTGSGKSTLLDSLIGALAVTRGRVACSRSVAYVPQQPWIMSATLRDNVVFFGAADAAAFERAVASSQLAADLALLADGAETEIGERGINLSGGQKARVSLARAVYADRDVYVLDDPLSALDAHVGERVMRECVCGALARKTRVLATHQVSAAAYADYVVLLQDGRVAFQGTYAAYSVYCDINAELPLSSAAPSPEETKLPSDLIDASSPVVGRRLTSAACVEASDDDEDDATVSVQTAVSHKTAKNEGGFKAPAKLIEAEEMAEGSVTRDVYLRYMRACAGMRVWWMLVALYVGTEVFIVSSRVWLSFWTSKRFSGMSDAAYLYLYLTLVITGIVAHPIRRLCAYPVLRHGCRTIHDELLRSISSGTMAFFDTTPLGRIVNRFSKDLDMIDDRQQESIIEVLELMCDLVSYLSVVLVTEPFVILPVIPCAYLYYRLSLFFTAANRTIRRHGNVSNAPVLALLNTVLTGRWTIEAYGCAKDMMKDAFSRMDLVFSCSFLQETGQQWLAVRVGMLTNVIVCSAAFFGVVTINIASAATAKSRVGLLSLSITLATQISFMLYMAIEKAADLEANMNAMERITHYTDNIEHEDTQQDIAVAVHVHAAQLRRLMDRAVEVTIEDGGDAKDLSAELSPMTPAPHGVSGIAATSPASGTAHAGSLAFEHVDMRYRPGLPLVLRDVCFAIAPGQKVGVVGRTGSGKSTLLLAFLRLVEVCGGRMLVCGRDARDYGVRELRQLFSMIPQDPLLFDGTVRSNVDPFGACGDAAVWAALRQVGMEERVRGEAGGLDGRVQEGGSNFSVGQRQLLCLARALLKRGSAFLLMDEATANVDPALDRQIQRTVQQTFRDYTVVTIAHRLHTVASYDMILVMDGGRAVEFDSPRNLISNERSVFSSLVRSMHSEARDSFMAVLNQTVSLGARKA